MKTIYGVYYTPPREENAFVEDIFDNIEAAEKCVEYYNSIGIEKMYTVRPMAVFSNFNAADYPHCS